MKMIDGLIFTVERVTGVQLAVKLECRAENGKIVNYTHRERWPKKEAPDWSDPQVQEAIRILTEWFESHTRPNMENVKQLAHPDRFKRPYKPAGYLRRLTPDEQAQMESFHAQKARQLN